MQSLLLTGCADFYTPCILIYLSISLSSCLVEHLVSLSLSLSVTLGMFSSIGFFKITHSIRIPQHVAHGILKSVGRICRAWLWADWWHVEGDKLAISTGYRYVASVATLAFIPTISISVWSMQINNETYGYIM